MRFNVPQFIEHETKIVGPLTFRQFIFIGTAGVIAFILYNLVPFHIFLVSAIVIGGTAAALAFLKIGGISLPSLIGNFLKFASEPKIYIWKRKEETDKNFFPTKTQKEETENSALKVTKGPQPIKLRFREKPEIK